jgi:hypothetical protein
MTALWVVACSLVETHRLLRSAYCLHHQGDYPETSISFYETTQSNMSEIVIFMLAAVRTWTLNWHILPVKYLLEVTKNLAPKQNHSFIFRHDSQLQTDVVSHYDRAGPNGSAVWGVVLDRLDAETVGSTPA